jgi:hypothetical protein
MKWFSIFWQCDFKNKVTCVRSLPNTKLSQCYKKTADIVLYIFPLGDLGALSYIIIHQSQYSSFITHNIHQVSWGGVWGGTPQIFINIQPYPSISINIHQSSWGGSGGERPRYSLISSYIHQYPSIFSISTFKKERSSQGFTPFTSIVLCNYNYK